MTPLCERCGRPLTAHAAARGSRFCSRTCANRAHAPEPDLAEVRRLYVDERLAGTTIAQRLDTNVGTVYRWLEKAGVPRRSASEARPTRVLSRQRVPRDRELLRRLYAVEENSAATIAAMFGVEKISVLRVLRELGIPRRTKRSHTDLCRKAQGVQRNAKPSKYEAALMGELNSLGLHPVLELAVGKYNIDLGFPDKMLAVEVDGGNWHRNARNKVSADASKEQHLVSAGWTLLRVSTRRPDWVAKASAAITQALHSQG